MTEHLRLNGVYWGLTALHLLGHPDALPRDETINFVLSCQHENGGFGAAPGHDAHMLYTVSAVQILVTVDAVDELSKRGCGGKEKVAECMTISRCNSFFFFFLLETGNDLLQISHDYRTSPQERLKGTSGVKPILDSSTARSMRYRYWDCSP